MGYRFWGYPIGYEGSLSRFKVQGNFFVLCSSTNFVGYSYIYIYTVYIYTVYIYTVEVYCPCTFQHPWIICFKPSVSICWNVPLDVFAWKYTSNNPLIAREKKKTPNGPHKDWDLKIVASKWLEESTVEINKHQKNKTIQKTKKKTRPFFPPKKIQKQFPQTHLVSSFTQLCPSFPPSTSVKAVATLDAKRSMRRGNSSGTAATWEFVSSIDLWVPGPNWGVHYCWWFRNPIPNHLRFVCFTRRK